MLRNPSTDITSTALHGKVEGKRGRPAMIYIDNIKKNTELSLIQIVRRRDADRSRRSIVHACGFELFAVIKDNVVYVRQSDR